MGQSEVEDFLKRNKGRWFTSRDIERGIVGIGFGSINTSLGKMRRTGCVDYKLGGVPFRNVKTGRVVRRVIFLYRWKK